MIHLKDISFKYKKDLPYVLKNININILNKEKILIAGPNGAGKTTLSKILSGILPKIENGVLKGDYFFNNKNVNDLTCQEILKKTGILLQDFESQLVTTTVKEELIFYPLNKNISYTDALKSAQRLAENFKIENIFNRDTSELSGGEKQKVALLSLLTANPEIIILDEPFTDIDPKTREDIIDFLMQEFVDKVVLVFEQTLNYFEYFDRIIIINNGEIIFDGNKKDLFNCKKVENAGLELPFVKKYFNGVDAVDFIKNNYIFDEEKYLNLLKDTEKSNETVILIKGLFFKYQGINDCVLKNINFEIKKGDFIIVAGPNGSGKTTLMKIIAGIISNKQGEIKKSINDLKISYIYQNPDNQIFADTVFNEVSFILKTSNINTDIIKQKTEDILKLMGLFDKKDEDPFNLPKGDRQKIACASILIAEPDVIIMDEPTTGLDIPSLNSLMSIVEELNNKGKTVIIITHDMDVVSKYGNKILVMLNGEILYYGNKYGVFENDEILIKANIKRTDIMNLTYKINNKLLLNEKEFNICWRKK
jgi:energy-coupling factor transport system ATP-binding protein